MSTPGTFVNFPNQLQGMLQEGFLDRELEEGLDSNLAYRREAVQETINARIGATLTLTRKGRKTPIESPLDPTTINQNLDNGMTASTFAIEQYSFVMKEYGDTVDTNLMQELAGIADQLIANSRNNGVQAAQSMERIARNALFNAYMSGNTRILASPAPTTTQCHVDDIRGFLTVLVNGNVQGVSAANPLLVTEYNTSGNLGEDSQVLQVTGAAADATNISSVPLGISGTLFYNTAGTTPQAGDAIIANNAPKIFRPMGKLATSLLVGSDVFTMGIVEDAVAYLRDNAVPPMPDGTYHCILDNTSMRQLWADQDFKVLFAGRNDTSEYRDGDIVRLLGVTYIPTTEAILQQKNTTAGINVRVRRPIVAGAESILQGNFEGLDIWLNRTGVNAIGEIMLVNNVAQIARPPLDRLQQNVALTWTWIGDFAVPTDVTATTDIIPTASNALYKRAVVIEHAG